MLNNELSWTGERLITTIKNYGAIEHLHRYAFASEFVANKTIADIACGEGYGSNILAQKANKVFGIDVSKEAIIHARNKYNNAKINFIEGNVEQIPLETSTIEIVVSFETLEHVMNQGKMLSEIKRILTEDGILIMSTPEKSNYQDKQIEKNKFHFKELYFTDFKELIEVYFKNVIFFKQKFLSGSLIGPFNHSNDFTFYAGDYNTINKTNTISEQTFNICVASDHSIHYPVSSFFDQGDFISDISIDHSEKKNEFLKQGGFSGSAIIKLPFKILKRIIR